MKEVVNVPMEDHKIKEQQAPRYNLKRNFLVLIISHGFVKIMLSPYFMIFRGKKETKEHRESLAELEIWQLS